MPKKRMSGKRRGRNSPAAGAVIRSERALPGGIRDSYRFSRTWFNATLSIAVGGGATGAINLNNGIPTLLASFLATYDLFKVDHAVVRFIPRFNVNGEGSITDSELPQIATVVNYDDSSAPASFDAVLGQGMSRMQRFDREVRVLARPYLLSSPYVVSGPQPPGILTPRDTWLNTSIIAAAWSMPLCKFAISVTTQLPANAKVDVYVEGHFIVAQHITG